MLGFVLYCSRRYDEAIDVHKKVVEVDSNFPGAYFGIAYSYLARGQLADATAWTEKVTFLGKYAPAFSIRGMLYAMAGRRSDAIAMMDQLKELSREQYVSPYWFFPILVGLGDLDG